MALQPIITSTHSSLYYDLVPSSLFYFIYYSNQITCWHLFLVYLMMLSRIQCYAASTEIIISNNKLERMRMEPVNSWILENYEKLCQDRSHLNMGPPEFYKRVLLVTYSSWLTSWLTLRLNGWLIDQLVKNVIRKMEKSWNKLIYHNNVNYKNWYLYINSYNFKLSIHMHWHSQYEVRTWSKRWYLRILCTGFRR